MSKDEDKQLPLIPNEPLHGESCNVELSVLPDNDELIGPDPEPDVIRSVGELGVVVPIILVRHRGNKGRQWYEVVYGRRRIKAARANKLTEIPARVYFDVSVELVQSLILQEQSLSRENPAVELDAIDALVNRGSNEKQIAAATGMPIQTIRNRLKLHDLTPELFAALRAGKLGVRVAEGAARLPKGTQVKLVEQFKDKGRLTQVDVAAAKRTEVDAAAAELPWAAVDAIPNAAEANRPRTVKERIDETFAGQVVEQKRHRNKDYWFVRDASGKAFRVVVEDWDESEFNEPS